MFSSTSLNSGPSFLDSESPILPFDSINVGIKSIEWSLAENQYDNGIFLGELLIGALYPGDYNNTNEKDNEKIEPWVNDSIIYISTLLAKCYYLNGHSPRAYYRLNSLKEFLGGKYYNMDIDSRYLFGQVAFSLEMWQECIDCLSLSNDLNNLNDIQNINSSIIHGSSGALIMGKAFNNLGDREKAISLFAISWRSNPLCWEAFKLWAEMTGGGTDKILYGNKPDKKNSLLNGLDKSIKPYGPDWIRSVKETLSKVEGNSNIIDNTSYSDNNKNSNPSSGKPKKKYSSTPMVSPGWGMMKQMNSFSFASKKLDTSFSPFIKGLPRSKKESDFFDTPSPVKIKNSKSNNIEISSLPKKKIDLNVESPATALSNQVAVALRFDDSSVQSTPGDSSRFGFNSQLNSTTGSEMRKSKDSILEFQSGSPPPTAVRRSIRLRHKNQNSSSKEKGLDSDIAPVNLGNKKKFIRARNMFENTSRFQNVLDFDNSKIKENETQTFIGTSFDSNIGSSPNKTDIPDSSSSSNKSTRTFNSIFSNDNEFSKALRLLVSLLDSYSKIYSAICSYQCQEVLELVKKIPSKMINTPWIQMILGRAHFELTNYSKGEEHFKLLENLNPFWFEGMEYYSTILWHLEKQTALSVLSSRLLSIERNSPEGWLCLGNCFSLLKNHQAAITFFERSIQISPRFVYAYSLLGHEYIAMENLEKGLLNYRSAVSLDVRHYNAWYGLGSIYHKQNNSSNALAHYGRAADINPYSSVLHSFIALMHYELGNMFLAEAALNKSLSINSENGMALFNRAKVYIHREKFEKAIQDLEKLKDLAPSEGIVYFLLGKLYARKGKIELAVTHLHDALDLNTGTTSHTIKLLLQKLLSDGEIDEEEV